MTHANGRLVLMKQALDPGTNPLLYVVESSTLHAKNPCS
jgi:hypothetical protein